MLLHSSVPSFVLFLCLGSAAVGNALEFPSMIGTLVPCQWKNALGMLCVRGYETIAVFPTHEQMQVMRAAGIPTPRGIGSRRKRSLGLDSHAPDGFFESSLRSLRRRKRSDDDDGFWDDDDTDLDNGFNNGTEYDYESILSKMLKKQWGGALFQTIDSTTCEWIRKNVQIDGAQKATQTIATFTEKSNFHPDPTKGTWLHQHVRGTLEKEAQVKPWMRKWIDPIVMNMQNCWYHRYWTKTDDDFQFTNDHSETSAAIKYAFFKLTCFK